MTSHVIMRLLGYKMLFGMHAENDPNFYKGHVDIQYDLLTLFWDTKHPQHAQATLQTVSRVQPEAKVLVINAPQTVVEAELNPLVHHAHGDETVFETYFGGFVALGVAQESQRHEIHQQVEDHFRAHLFSNR